ncbi:nucleotide sugar dehydrogenase [Synechococcus sp. PCC 7336]|uniref:nucleotide sugar dehydrogenase n=1 Tax=Synechococcus sp. PCC 7336 TaxID=195250 RepID=UPI00034AC6E2|nr:nucleotide sugar dehydrogenase [Synechococcus sp. PCC 7336]
MEVLDGNRIGIIGLGYVGLPVALAFAKHFPETIGFDINSDRIRALKDGIDWTLEASEESLRSTNLQITSVLEDLASCNLFIVTVPTPIDSNNRPNLEPIQNASRMIGEILKVGDIVVYESTVYPGVTEEICGPILATTSGLKQGIDFKLGYSPERINPGDKNRTLEKIVKIVSAEDRETLQRLKTVYGMAIEAGLHLVDSIKIAEAAKVIENIQRDLNIALMNELAMVFDRLEIRTADVLAAAKTKWNFLEFTPGLVGGHCIGVDPYYLTAKAEELGYRPHVILAGRQVNDGMGTFIAQKAIELLIQADLPVPDARIFILGLTFKENIPDTRNSRVPEIVSELQQFGVRPWVHDPLADPQSTHQNFEFNLIEWQDIYDADCLILAVPHRFYLEVPKQELFDRLRPGGVLMDIKSVFHPNRVPTHLRYWSL